MHGENEIVNKVNNIEIIHYQNTKLSEQEIIK